MEHREKLVKKRFTDYSDSIISDRHREAFGYHMFINNFDWLGFHYELDKVTDICEFKHCSTKKIDLNSFNYKALINMADKLEVPCFIIFYNEEDWSYYLIQINKSEKVWKYAKKPMKITEKNLISALYKIKGREISKETLDKLSSSKYSDDKIPEIVGLVT